MCVGFDTSLSSIAAAAFGWDEITKQMRGPAFVMRRFGRDDDYFTRLHVAVRPEEIIFDLIADLKMPSLRHEDIWIAQEEPFPAHGGFTKRGISQSLKQQAEISGALLGGLVRWRYQNVFQIRNDQWRSLVANQLFDTTGEQITIHYTKWRSPELAARYNCKPDDSGKFRAQQWAELCFEPWIAQNGGVSIPHFPPLIQHSKDGKIPRPESSTAKSFQCDDRYEALAMAEWMRVERTTIVGYEKVMTG